MCVIEKDSICFLSEMGHKGFLYPDKNNHAIIVEGSKIQTLPWLKMLDLTPIKVKIDNLLGDYSFKSNFTVVWIRSKNIKNALFNY